MPKEELTLEELQKQFNEFKEQKEKEVNELKTSLEEEKKKSLSFSITSVTKKVEQPKQEEPTTFDFDF